MTSIDEKYFKPTQKQLDEEFIGACYTNKLFLIKICLDLGADVNAKNMVDKNAFDICISNPQVRYNETENKSTTFETIKYLISRGLKIEKRKDMIHYIIQYTDDVNIISYFLEQGYDINEPSDSVVSKETPLICAINRGKTELAKFLIEKGANIDKKSNNVNPLYQACFQLDYHMIEFLIEKGVKVENSLLAAPFMKFGSTVYYTTRPSFEHKIPKIISVLLKNGCDLTFKDTEGRTILHHAVRFNMLAVVIDIINEASEKLEEKEFIDFIETEDTHGIPAIGLLKQYSSYSSNISVTECNNTESIRKILMNAIENYKKKREQYIKNIKLDIDTVKKWCGEHNYIVCQKI